MKSANRVLSLISMILILALSACNLPVAKSSVPSGLDPQNIALTMVAGTMQARVTPTQATSIPVAAPTSSNPLVTVSIATNCRTGPDANYPFVMLFQPGMTAPVVGKYSPSNYWIISMPNGGTCWLWGAYASVQGNVGNLPESTPPQLALAPQPTVVPVQSGNDNSGNQNSGSNNNSGNQNSGNNGSGTNPLVTIQPLTIVTQPVFVVIAPPMPASLKVTTYCDYIGTPPKLKTRTDVLNWATVANIDGYYIYVNGNQTFKSPKNGVGYQVPAAISLTATSYGIATYRGNQSSKTRTATPNGCK